MIHFDLHTLDTAPAAAIPLLENSQSLYGGMIPNLHAIMAEAPALLDAYQALNQIITRASFDTQELNIVWLTVNYENACRYCMAAHTVVARHAGVAEADIQALRNGVPLSDERHEALRQFTRLMVAKRGWASDTELADLLDAGYTKQTALDVVLVIGMKTLSNYTNHIAHTPVDKAFVADAWEK